MLLSLIRIILSLIWVALALISCSYEYLLSEKAISFILKSSWRVIFFHFQMILCLPMNKNYWRFSRQVRTLQCWGWPSQYCYNAQYNLGNVILISHSNSSWICFLESKKWLLWELSKLWISNALLILGRPLFLNILWPQE